MFMISLALLLVHVSLHIGLAILIAVSWPFFNRQTSIMYCRKIYNNYSLYFYSTEKIPRKIC